MSGASRDIKKQGEEADFKSRRRGHAFDALVLTEYRVDNESLLHEVGS